MNKIFYDFEVFVKDWMVVCINYETKEHTYIINDTDKLLEFYTDNNENIWIGYNNRNYDQYILKGLLFGLNPYEISKGLIEDKISGNTLVPDNKEIQLYNFDLSNKFRGLKELEGFIGSKIKESSVDFNIKRKLKKHELDEVLEYCIHDVEQTIEVYENSKEELDSQTLMIEAFNLPMDKFDNTKARLSAFVLDAEKPEEPRNDDFDLSFPDTLILSDKYNFILDWYKNPENMNYKKKLFCNVANVPHIFAWGGIHGAIPSYNDVGEFIMSDIASMYPALMIEYNYLSRNVIDPSKYKEIRDKRLVLKKEKNPMQLPLKIVLNSTYGAMKDQYNDLFDPLMANNVCVGGQLLLLDLIEKVEPYCELVQSNTDGILVKVNSKEDKKRYLEECDKWCKRTRLDLEHDKYVKVVQKDVNNYIIVEEDGGYKSKGGYVKKLNKIDFDLPIVNDALINYFVKDIPIEETINNCNEFIKFQKIVKISRKYLYGLHNDEKIREKVLRVFASTTKNDGTVFKIKIEGKQEKIANTPEQCFIFNDEVNDLECPNKLDKQYYIDIANDRVFKFLNNTVKEHKIETGIKFVNYDSMVYLNELLKCESYIDVVKKREDDKIMDRRSLKILSNLDYFKKFGSSQKLNTFLEFYEKINKKNYNKEKTDKNLLRFIKKYSEEKPKTYVLKDKDSLMSDYWKSLGNDEYPWSYKLKYQFDYLDYCETNYPTSVKVAHVKFSGLSRKKNFGCYLVNIQNKNEMWFSMDKNTTPPLKDSHILITDVKKTRKGYELTDFITLHESNED